MSRKRMRTRRRWAEWASQQEQAEQKKRADEWEAAMRDMDRIARLPSFMPKKKDA